MCPYLSLSRRNPHTVIRSNRRTLWSQHQFPCTPTLASTLSTSCCSCILNAGCFWEVRVQGHFLRIFRNICILWDFYSFLCFHLAPYLCGGGPCGMWFFFVEWGGTAIATWTERGSGECIIFIFLFVYAVPFSVLVSRCRWPWWRLHSPRFYMTGIGMTLAAVVPTVGAWSSPDWPCPPILPAPLLSFDLARLPLWRLFAVLRG